MEEDSLKQSLETYKQQLQHVELAIQAAGSSDDLNQLKSDLVELIELTEGSLLSLKKSQLLNHLEDTDHGGQRSNPGGTQTSSEMDDEYAAFQALLSDDITPSVDQSTTSVTNQIPEDQSRDSEPGLSSTTSLSEVYKDLIGTKCRAPFSHHWGSKSYSNALISGIEAVSDLEMPKVRVMFSNPTHSSMLPCKYFLEGSCRFSEEDCRYSHGYLVEVEELQEYMEPDYSQVKMESHCLACYHDDLWYPATVVDLDDDVVTVTFDSYNDEPIKLRLEEILPLDNGEDDEAASDDSNKAKEGKQIYRDSEDEEEDEEEELPVFLWKPSPVNFGDLGQWEVHTKGIGSRLLAQMGYKVGEGLGKNGEGRIQPVPIQLLPQGKSLDRIMQLKEIAGEKDLFDAMKKQERKKKKQDEKIAKGYVQKEKSNVFDFINKRLGGKKGKLSDLVHKHEGQGPSQGPSQGHNSGRLHRNISEQDLQKKSGKDINIQLLKTSEEMKSVEKELTKLRQSLSRNEARDKTVASRYRAKIQSLEAYLEKLRHSESALTNHQQKRTDHKKLTIF